MGNDFDYGGTYMLYWSNRWNVIFRFVLCAFGMLFSIGITLEISTKKEVILRQNEMMEKMIDMQNYQYDYQMKKTVEIRKFRHDLKNHMGHY
ncbi:MAG: hypothetical protein II169_07850 [Lachnospiraceae bacterium]|nr:hypothetical protein [Lachnospiraceae bacterium]